MAGNNDQNIPDDEIPERVLLSALEKYDGTNIERVTPQNHADFLARYQSIAERVGITGNLPLYRTESDIIGASRIPVPGTLMHSLGILYSSAVEDLSPAAQDFVIAHELGHHLECVQMQTENCRKLERIGNLTDEALRNMSPEEKDKIRKEMLDARRAGETFGDFTAIRAAGRQGMESFYEEADWSTFYTSENGEKIDVRSSPNAIPGPGDLEADIKDYHFSDATRYKRGMQMAQLVEDTASACQVLQENPATSLTPETREKLEELKSMGVENPCPPSTPTETKSKNGPAR